MRRQVRRAGHGLMFRHRPALLVLSALLLAAVSGCAPTLPTFNDQVDLTAQPGGSLGSALRTLDIEPTLTTLTSAQRRTPRPTLPSRNRVQVPTVEPTLEVVKAQDTAVVRPQPVLSDLPTATPFAPLREATESPVVTTPTPGLSPEIIQARRHWRNGELGAALLAYRQVTVRGPAPAEIFVELAAVELANGDLVAARDTLQRILNSATPELLRARALYLLATVELERGNWQEVIRTMDVPAAPDGLVDLVVLRRAEAAANGGNIDGARAELERPEVRTSTNRMILEQAGDLAERIGESGLTGEFYARAGDYPGWSAERSRLIAAAAMAFADAGRTAEAIGQYRRLVELYAWTNLGKEAGNELSRLGGMTPYHKGRLTIIDGGLDAARGSLQEAAQGGDHATSAQELLDQIDEILAWREAADVATAESYRSFRTRFPEGIFLEDAWFQEGYAHYQQGRLTSALSVWRSAVGQVKGDYLARVQLWLSKTLRRMGQGEEAVASLRAAAQTGPADYYAMRARDLLAGVNGWPESKSGLKPSSDDERRKAKEWLSSWDESNATPNMMAQTQVRRGLGLLDLGLHAEANAELNGLIKEAAGGQFLFELAQMLAEREVWGSSSRAAWRIVELSPVESVTEAPIAVQKLAYPQAFPDLVAFEAARHNLDPLLLLTMIHQESLYDPFAISISDARGLTQVIPSTGRLIANALDWPDFSPDELYRPVVAFEFGAWFLANQLKTFDGDPFRALAAYNAGSGPISRWWTDDVDQFIERIDYAETRKYLRQVYFHHAVYRSLASG